MKWDIAADNMDRKKELKEQYKQMKTEMGIFIIQNKINNKYLLVTTQNLHGMINRTRFQLKSYQIKTWQYIVNKKNNCNSLPIILHNLNYVNKSEVEKRHTGITSY